MKVTNQMVRMFSGKSSLKHHEKFPWTMKLRRQKSPAHQIWEPQLFSKNLIDYKLCRKHSEVAVDAHGGLRPLKNLLGEEEHDKLWKD